MVNHILHPLGDRTICEPDRADSAAIHVSVPVDWASCPDCIENHESVVKRPVQELNADLDAIEEALSFEHFPQPSHSEKAHLLRRLALNIKGDELGDEVSKDFILELLEEAAVAVENSIHRSYALDSPLTDDANSSSANVKEDS